MFFRILQSEMFQAGATVSFGCKHVPTSASQAVGRESHAQSRLPVRTKIPLRVCILRLALIQCPGTGAFRRDVPAQEAVFNSFSQLTPERRSHWQEKKATMCQTWEDTLRVQEHHLIFSTLQILFLKIKLLSSKKSNFFFA